jgi:two-component system response regulator
MSYNEIEIILIEDNMDDAALAIHSLRQKKLTNKIIHLKNGDEALRYFFSDLNGEKSSPAPKIIFLDLKMPKVDGIEVLTRLKSDPMTKNIPVIILTSSNEDPDIARCYELGANSYVVKPIAFENFSEQISQLGFYWTVLNRASMGIGNETVN